MATCVDLLENLMYSIVGLLAGIGLTASVYRSRGYKLHRG